ncbi:MAG: hypothetical protein ABIQ61_05620 [Ornithinibacter sp.]
MEIEGDDQLEHRRERDIALQRVIDALVQECTGQSEAQVADRLREELAGLDLPQMPGSWFDSVIDSITRGDAYVVSSFSQSHTDIPEPRDRPRTQPPR